MNHFYSKFSFALVAFCFFISLSSKAQETTFTPEHLKAAQELFNATDEKAKLQTAITTVVKLQSMKLPEDKRAAFEEVMHNFMNKYLTWELISDKMSDLYAGEFTTEELQQLTAFYKTPTGKKYALKLPQILLKTEQIGQQLASAHQEELKTMMQNAFTKK